MFILWTIIFVKKWLVLHNFPLFFRMTHKLIFEDEERKRKVIDANVQELDRYEIYDPRNPLTKRRRENSKQTMKEKKHKTWHDV